MSLINDALKKAQRQRAEPPAGTDPAPGAGGVSARVEKRSQAMRTQSVILIAAGAAVLVILSVVATVYLLSRPSPPTRSPAVATKAPPPAAQTPVSEIVLPITAPLTVVEKATPSPATEDSPPVLRSPNAGESPSPITPSPTANDAPPVPTPPSTVLRPPPPVLTPPSPAVTAPSSVLSTPSSVHRPPSSANLPDARIQAFVDAIRVTGIRSSGADSKVLMNDRVYRVNDLVDRTLGVKLVKVESDQLSFTDAAGLIYTKNF